MASTIQSTQIPASSRYKETPLYGSGVTGAPEFGLWESDPSFRNDTKFVSYVVRDYDIGRLDLLAYRFYGNPAYWWMIADANDMISPIADMYVGQTIKIPSRAESDRYVQSAPA